MAAESGFWFKLKHMDRGMLVKKMLSFDNVYVIAVRRIADGKTLPEDKDREFVQITDTRDFWYADPSLFEWKGDTWLFVEAFDRKTLLGGIACCKLCDDPAEDVKKLRVVIKENFHMSFPQVFEWNGGLYMIPETGDDHSLILYRAVDFPDKWERVVRIQTESVLADTAVVKKESGRLTLLTSELSTKRQYFQRYHRMYLTDKGNGRWELTDDEEFLSKQEFSYIARNAGSLYEEGGQIMLPTQESTETVYGVRLNFVRYDENEADIFAQRTGSIGPEDVTVRGFGKGRASGGRLDGVHSYARSRDYEVIDLYYNEFTPLKHFRKIAKKLKY